MRKQFLKQQMDRSISYQSWSYLTDELKKDKSSLIISICASSLGFFTGNFLSYYFVSRIINTIVTDINSSNVDILQEYGFDIAMYIACVVVSNFILWRLYAYVVWKQHTKIINSLYYRCYETILYEKMQFFRHHTTEDIVQSIENFISGILTLDKILRGDIVPVISSIVFTAIILGPSMPLYTLILLLSSILFLWVAFWTSRRIRSKSQTSSDEQTSRTEMIYDIVENIAVVKSSGGVQKELHRMNGLNMAISNEVPKFFKSYFQREYGFAFVITFASALLVFVISGAHSWFNTDVGTIVLASSYTAIIMQQLWNITFIFKDIYTALLNTYNMTRILQAAKTHKKSKKSDLEVTSGRIDFSNITFQFNDFRYKLSNTKMFNKFNLSIEPKQRVGIVGHSGAGKTTLIKFLMRFIEDYRGTISIDGQDIAKVWQYDLHSQIGYIGQDAKLFNVSVRDNITYGLKGITDSQIEDAARQAEVWDLIQSLPEGLNTVLGENGIILSGGQIQCINIAREILKNPKIVILDEPASEVDPDIEQKLVTAFSHLLRGKTAIVVAHRLSFISQLDRIVVLDKGHIAEDGTHSELLKLNGIYKSMWDWQTRNY